MKKSTGLADVETTSNTLFDGALRCLQHRIGYRFSIDPVLLAHFVRLTRDEAVLDLGAGCGVIGLILLYRARERIRMLTALELQTGLTRLIEENISINHFEKVMQVVEGDLRNIQQYFVPESFSTVVCNPPFYPAGSGRVSSCKESEIARHQVACSLPEVIAAAAVAVKNRGRVYLVYPAEGLGDLLHLLASQQLIVKRMQLVYSYPDKSMAARLLLLEAVKNGGEGVDVRPPLYIYDRKNGDYSEAMQQFYKPN
ncbi:putative O-methyltransferase [Desulfocapsa sulfexigens DSM 10523]|uniref:Putative O-methyltransferase n=1 Tax=Desulfocapsa sulfexigens (strain DSM 10523 / SB164P1) TaxID=1167006 RepID=M1NJK7_DESSD|nr:methyltransferase [Desulfocapsa sulfexigens]AGF79759.1 putative O-methyltransferase [Desulfocapsa sulfexigens DSM 10523]